MRRTEPHRFGVEKVAAMLLLSAHFGRLIQPSVTRTVSLVCMAVRQPTPAGMAFLRATLTHRRAEQA